MQSQNRDHFVNVMIFEIYSSMKTNLMRYFNNVHLILLAGYGLGLETARQMVYINLKGKRDIQDEQNMQ